MKKLMFAAVAVAAATTFADISSNVVGYQNNNLQNGATMLTSTFVPVTGTEALDLLDIKLGGTYAGGQVTIETLTTAGLCDKSYTYMYSVKSGWYWSDGAKKITEKGEVTFEPGAGLWIVGVDGSQVTFAGAVSTADRVVALKEGAIATGNMTAVPVDLVDIEVAGITEAQGGRINIQTLTSAGLCDKSYSLMYSVKSGWYWSDGVKKIAKGDVVFDPGKGLWVVGVDGATMKFPGPTL